MMSRALNKTPSQKLWDVTCYFHLTQVKYAARLNPSQRPVLDLPTPERWKAQLTRWLVTHRVGVVAHRRSPI